MPKVNRINSSNQYGRIINAYAEEIDEKYVADELTLKKAQRLMEKLREWEAQQNAKEAE